MPAEVSLFFLRLIHSNLGMPLKASAGMLVMLLPGGYISLNQLTVGQKMTDILLTVYTVCICQFGAPFLLLVTKKGHKGQNFITWFVTNQDFWCHLFNSSWPLSILLFKMFGMVSLEMAALVCVISSSSHNIWFSKFLRSNFVVVGSKQENINNSQTTCN